VKNGETDALLKKFMEKFADWALLAPGKNCDHGFTEFMAEREKAAAAYVKGNATPLDAMVTENDPATFFHPKGKTFKGAKAVRNRYDADAKAFGSRGTTRLEVLQSGSSGKLAFWTGLQHAKAQLGGKMIPMTLRITEIFRFEGGWRLVHRHAEGVGEK
jgi:ketosteroid isomerase-like protein